jgi:DNA (cytosine-5)-methyltransferase 1
MLKRSDASVVDLFCGAGGLTQGFVREGFTVAAGIDADESCRYAYEYNNNVPFVRRDVWTLSASELKEMFYPGTSRVMVGCAPCQPFSTYNQGNRDVNWQLVDRFGELVEQTGPDIVSMENVPALLQFERGTLFSAFTSRLERRGYHVAFRVVAGQEYGLPQLRRRLVLLASRLGPIEMVVEKNERVTVWDFLQGLPSLEAGRVDPCDPLHRAAALSVENLNRIRISRPGGTWRDWPLGLRAACHRSSAGKTYTGVYGRISPDGPAPTITTQFYGYGNGRFGHPYQDRALSLREGALLQTFPAHYVFTAPGTAISMKNVGRMIGNAVPVLLGRLIARSVASHLRRYK